MRENRPYGSEGGESGSTGLPYPYLSVDFSEINLGRFERGSIWSAWS